jgi:MarR family transcriptional regulator for hemolysin
MSLQDQSLGFLLADAARVMRRSFERRSNPYGLSTAQWRLLVILGRDGPSSQSHLAETLDIEPISVSRLIDRMEAAGWVARHPNPADRRARIIMATARAQQIHTRIREISEQIYDDALATLGDAEREILKHALAMIVANLSDQHMAKPQTDATAEHPPPPDEP